MHRRIHPNDTPQLVNRHYSADKNVRNKVFKLKQRSKSQESIKKLYTQESVSNDHVEHIFRRLISADSKTEHGRCELSSKTETNQSRTAVRISVSNDYDDTESGGALDELASTSCWEQDEENDDYDDQYGPEMSDDEDTAQTSATLHMSHYLDDPFHQQFARNFVIDKNSMEAEMSRRYLSINMAPSFRWSESMIPSVSNNDESESKPTQPNAPVGKTLQRQDRIKENEDNDQASKRKKLDNEENDQPGNSLSLTMSIESKELQELVVDDNDVGPSGQIEDSEDETLDKQIFSRNIPSEYQF